MEIVTKTMDQATVVAIAGEIDGSTAPSAQATILPMIEPGGRILLDMTGVTYMSSAGLRMLLSTYRHVAEKDGHIVLVGLSEEIRDTMSVTGFLNFFMTCEDVTAGLAALAE